MASISPIHPIASVDWASAVEDADNVCVLTVNQIWFRHITKNGRYWDVRTMGGGNAHNRRPWVFPGHNPCFNLVAEGIGKWRLPVESRQGHWENRIFHPETGDLRKWVCKHSCTLPCVSSVHVCMSSDIVIFQVYIGFYDGMFQNTKDRRRGALYPLLEVQIHSSWHEEREEWRGEKWVGKKRPRPHVVKVDKPVMIILFHNPATKDWIRRERSRIDKWFSRMQNGRQKLFLQQGHKGKEAHEEDKN